METNKPLLAALFFIGLSFWAIQFAQAATTENTLNPLVSFKTRLPDLPSAYHEQLSGQVSNTPLPEYASALFTRVKTRALMTFKRALSDVEVLGDSVSQTGFFNLLGIVFQPVLDKSKTAELKTALPKVAWLFLGGMLGILSLQKRSSQLDAKSNFESIAP